MSFYHFTSRQHILRIQESGVIRTTESNVGSVLPVWKPFGEGFGPDVVWLLDTTEITHSHGLIGARFDKREVYIEVDVPAIRWLDWSWAQKMHPEWRRIFMINGGGPAAASHWYVWPRQIPQANWVKIGVNERQQKEGT